MIKNLILNLIFLNILDVETSSKNRTNVDQVFVLVARQINGYSSYGGDLGEFTCVEDSVSSQRKEQKLGNLKATNKTTLFCNLL